jgi:farnesyl diphosphate synthase/geranylgeranyl diphosphate synthase type II
MDYPAIIEEQLAHYIPNNALHSTIAYSLLDGGKRFRSSLCYLTAEIFNTDIQKIHTSSCALEMIHAYSLIHDDLPAMDDDDIRRGKLTSHKKFNEADAILAGDGLQTLAFKIIADDKNLDSDIKIKLLHVLTNASFDMVLGQKLDINSGDNPTIEELENINKLKTGAILKASVLMGSIASGNDDKINQIFENFAENLAKAYQVQDDCFDFKDSTEIGKTNNANKTTFATILGFENATKHYQNLYDNALKELQKIDNSDKLQDLVLIMKNRNF